MENKAKSKDWKPNLITVYCSECEREVTLQWDFEQDGYKSFCPYCGERLMMCSYCDHLEDCDYDQASDSCRYNRPAKEETIEISDAPQKGDYTFPFWT